MQIKTIIFIFFGMLFSMGFTQEKYSSFRAFGEIPSVVDASLYQNLNAAETQEIRFQYLDTIAQVYVKSGHADSLMHYAKLIKNEALYKASDIKDVNIIKQRALYFEGIATQKMGLLDEAIKSYIQGLEIETSKHSFQKHLKLQLAEVYLTKGEFEKARLLLEELPQAKTDNNFYLKNTIAKSRFLILKNNNDLAAKMINEALSEDFIEKHQKLKLELQLNLSEIELNQGNFERLIQSSDRIKNEALDKGFYDLYIEASLNIGFAYAMLDNFDVSEVVLSSAYINSIQWHRLELQKKVINALVKLYNAKEDYKNAYNLMTQYQSVNREIENKQNQRLVKDLELKYETLKKEREISQLQEDQLLQQAEIERQTTIKYAFLIGFLIILIPVILLLVVYYQKLQTQSLLNKQQEAMNQQEVENLLQTQELDLAKNAIAVQSKERDRIARELHDSIGGNLAGIKLKMNSLDNHQPEFRQILNQLDTTYNQVRDISHSLIPKEFETSAFIDLVTNYIHNIRDNATVSLLFNAYPKETINTIAVSLQVALFNMIKELVTNALKHAKADEVSIQMTALSEENSIELIYEDDGLGFDLNKTSKGIGLKNIEKRVADFKGTISINTAENRGTVISISLPQS
ncbi:tetratricopeptide repeat-containing sensor histidine kinase [Winogradskyella vidalii]|uniref:tetratricopeptide repeat-containing sensor histidine kinase n=1 Tax=Winogradskyella vidalii TaxID=2615024 RepID=UPI0015CD7093|nr:ATP-binding protein [Winogradskyella vidalii]